MIKIKNLTKKYIGFELKIDSLVIDKPGIYSFFGKSGSGKSTLLNILSGLDNDYQGSYLFNDKLLSGLSLNELSKFRYNNIGYIHQKSLLFEELKVRDNIFFDLNKKDISISLYKELINKTKIENIQNRYCNVLSGGEKQRVCFVREFLKKPNILILDEPTANVDLETSKIIINLIKEYSKNHIVILVSHDLKFVKENSNIIYHLEDGKIIDKEQNIQFENNDLSLIKKNSRNDKIKLSFALKYIFTIYKRKKIRNFFAIFITFISLISFSFSFLLNNNVSEILKYNFSQYYEENQIILERKDEIKNDVYKRDSVQEYNLFPLMENYSDCIKNYGYLYESDFESFFKDNNELRVNYKNRSQKLSKYTIRNINEFLDTDLIEDKTYVSKITNLFDDEIIISIDNDLLKEICSCLSIKASFSTLYSYIKTNDLYLSFYLKNYDWSYEDEQLFKLVGFVVNNDQIIYHSNPFFNETVFEKMMKFPSTIYQGKQDEPWVLKKTVVLNLYDNGEKIFDNYYSDPNLYNLSFTKVSKKYLRNARNLVNNKYLVYKNYDDFDYGVISKLTENNFNEIYLTNVGGYMSLGHQVMSGFVNDIYFTNNAESKDKIIDSISGSSDKQVLNVDNYENIIYGGLNLTSDKIVRFKYIKDLPNGEYNEIVISKAMADYLKIKVGDDLVFVNKNKEFITDGNFKVANIINDNGFYVYGNQTWSYKFFLTNFNYEYYDLIPYSIIVNNVENNEVLLGIFKDNFKNFDIFAPLNEINNEIDSILFIIEIILFVFSLMTSIISIMILFFISKSLMVEYSNDATILFCFGKNKSGSAKIFKVYVLTILISVLFSSMFFNIFMHFFIAKLINNILHVSYIPNFNYLVLVYLTLFLLVIFFISTFSLTKNIKEKELVKNLNKI